MKISLSLSSTGVVVLVRVERLLSERGGDGYARAQVLKHQGLSLTRRSTDDKA